MLSSDNILKSYVNVCNHALRLNADRFPFKQILGAVNQSEQQRKVEVQIDSDHKVKSYILYLNKAQIMLEAHKDCDVYECVRQWRVSLHYLKDVAINPELYIQNPAMIDWGWLYDSPKA